MKQLKENALDLILTRISFLTDNLEFRKKEQDKRQDYYIEIAISNLEAEINFLKMLVKED